MQVQRCKRAVVRYGADYAVYIGKLSVNVVLVGQCKPSDGIAAFQRARLYGGNGGRQVDFDKGRQVGKCVFVNALVAFRHVHVFD